MSDIVIVGTDTDVGKTTFALLWLSAFAALYEYWKPAETGDSDTEKVRRLVPVAAVHKPLVRFRQAVAPPLAARLEGGTIPSAADIAAARPAPRHGDCSLLIETFGSPLSPLNGHELQTALLRRLEGQLILICSSAVGAIGRALQCVTSLGVEALRPAGLVLVGPPDKYAAEQLRVHGHFDEVFSLEPPRSWDVEGIRRATEEQSALLQRIRARVARPLQPIVPEPLLTDLLARDRASVWHPYTSLGEPDLPLVAVAAKDEFIWLADGRRVIDGISSWWTIQHGHRYSPLMAALARAAALMDHVQFAGVTHADAVELAGLLLGTMPWTGGRVFYSDNGSTAVEVALKMAYQYWCHLGEPQRTWFVGFEGGYHGDTFGAMSAGRDPLFFGRFEPLMFQTEIVPVAAERLDEVLTRHKGQVAAVILEPLVQGAGGMRMHTAPQLRALFEVTRRHEVLFIADEVMTGGGRTGPLWAHQAAPIAPDLVCAAKTLAGGVLPLAATLVAQHVVAAFDTADRSRTFFHGHSFTGHPLACAVALTNWRLLTNKPAPHLTLSRKGGEGKVRVAEPERMEEFWREALVPLEKCARVREIRIRGTIAAVELNVPGGYLAEVGRELRGRCLEKGVLLRPLGNVVYAMPPFCTSTASMEQIAEAIKYAIASLRS
jgi:adenosylmethionine-8-amino-7-oxononanoate aminotransferase